MRKVGENSKLKVYSLAMHLKKKNPLHCHNQEHLALKTQIELSSWVCKIGTGLCHKLVYSLKAKCEQRNIEQNEFETVSHNGWRAKEKELRLNSHLCKSEGLLMEA